MRVVVNPKYAYLTEFIQSIPKQEYECDLVFRDYRNVLQKVTVDGTAMVIKRYKRPTIANCFIYSYFRTNKAKRSYEYAFRLEEMGFATAEPIAYIEIKKNGFFHTGYFISSFLSHPLLDTINEYDAETKTEIIKDFAAYTADLNEKGIVHYDYNLSNIFFYKEDGKSNYQFALIDINRMRFKHFSKRKCIKGLKTIQFELPYLAYMAECYATQL